MALTLTDSLFESGAARRGAGSSRPDAAGEPEARERHCDGEDADGSKMKQGFAGTPLQNQPTTYGAEAAGDVLHRRIDRHEATAPSGLNAGRDQ